MTQIWEKGFHKSRNDILAAFPEIGSIPHWAQKPGTTRKNLALSTVNPLARTELCLPSDGLHLFSHKSWKFLAVIGTIESYKAISRRPAGSPLISTSRKHVVCESGSEYVRKLTFLTFCKKTGKCGNVALSLCVSKIEWTESRNWALAPANQLRSRRFTRPTSPVKWRCGIVSIPHRFFAVKKRQISKWYFQRSIRKELGNFKLAFTLQRLLPTTRFSHRKCNKCYLRFFGASFEIGSKENSGKTTENMVDLFWYR